MTDAHFLESFFTILLKVKAMTIGEASRIQQKFFFKSSAIFF